jgi:hypothetical protein
MAHSWRQNIPPLKTSQLEQRYEQGQWLASLDMNSLNGDVFAVYGDDME